jgi:uncharacterized protein (DUF1778 family)
LHCTANIRTFDIMDKALKIKDRKTRFDARIPETQKALFEKAAGLAGYRTLTDFLISSAQEKANAIIQQHNIILASQKDQEIFFESVINPPKPNEHLKKAFENYQQALNGK